MANFLTRDDERNFGPEVLDLAQRAAMHATEPHLRSLEAQNDELRQRLAQQERHSLHQQVAAAIPNWREINADPAWRQWLEGTDEFSGRRRQTLLDEAVARGDAAAVIAFFKGGQAGARAAVPADNQSMTSPRARATDAQGKRIYSRAEVARLLDPRRRGKKSDIEWQRLQLEIIAAGREGRIRDALDPNGK